MDHGRQRLTLLLVSALVDNRLHRTVAFEHRPRPSVEEAVAKAIKRDAAEVATFDPAHLEASAIAVAGAALELARAAVIAVAVAERDSLYAPIDHGLEPAALVAFDDALIAEVNMGELTVAVLQVELDRATRLGGAAAHFGDAVLEAVR